MDTLREEDREINHHGKPRDVGDKDKDEAELTPVENVVKVSPANLRHRNEAKEVDARRNFYNQIKQAQRNKDKLKRCKRIGRVDIPIVIFVFVLSYWVYGITSMS